MKALVKAVLPEEMFERVSRQRYRQRRIRRYRRLRNQVDNGYSLQGYDRLKCIYVHIPKNAGVSVTRGIFGNLGGGHLTAQEYRKVFGKRLFDRYFKFAIARNPWDRVFSAYRFLRAGGMGDEDRQWADRHLSRFDSFGDFVRRGLDREEIRNALHFRPQCDFVCEPDATTLMVDYIGYLETLDQDFQTICGRLGITATLPRLNVSGENRYLAQYDAETRAIVARRYHRDIELFGYDFDGIRQRLDLSAP